MWHIKIYQPCNFEVYLITHGVIALFSSIFFLILKLFVLYFKNYLEIDVKFKLQKCAACQDLPNHSYIEENLITHFDRLCKLEKRGDEIKQKSSPLKLLSQSQPNFAELILGWSSSKIVSVSTVLYPRWPPLLKIEISSNGQKLLYFKPESAQI